MSCSQKFAAKPIDYINLFQLEAILILPIISGGHSTYQDTFVSDFSIYYPDLFSLSKQTWNTIIEFWHLDLSFTDTFMQDYYSKFGPAPRTPSCMLRSYLLSIKLKVTSITVWVSMLKECPLYAILSGFPANGTPIRTATRIRRKRIYNCKENGILKCNCKRLFSQPDCNGGWDSSRDCYFNGYHLYMFVASDSHSDLPVFPLLERAS